MTNHQPDTPEQILRKVRDAGALDDNNGAEDWSHSDKVIEEAQAALLSIALEAAPDKGTDNKSYRSIVEGLRWQEGFNAAVDQYREALVSAFKPATHKYTCPCAYGDKCPASAFKSK